MPDEPKEVAAAAPEAAAQDAAPEAEAAPAGVAAEAPAEAAAPDTAPAAGEEGTEAKDDEGARDLVAALAERLRFFFSDSNLRQDRWMRQRLERDGSLSLDALLRFHTIKAISEDKALLARAARSEGLVGFIVLDGERGEVRRVKPFDWATMGDGRALSLYVKGIPLTKEEDEAGKGEEKEDASKGGVNEDEKEGEGSKSEDDKAGEDAKMKDVEKKENAEKKEEEEKKDAKMEDCVQKEKEEVEAETKEENEEDACKKDDEKKDTKMEDAEKKEGKTDDGAGEEQKQQPFRPRYAVTRDDVKKLFEPYGRVGIVKFRYEQRREEPGWNHRGRHNRAGGRPLGHAIVEFAEMEGLEKACGALIGKDEEGPTTVLEMLGSELRVERMKKPPARGRGQQENKNNNGKRSREEEGEDDGKDEEPVEEVKFEPIKLDWEKGCVVGLSGLSTSNCDRESIREAVSSVLGVSTDVKTSGLWVDYNRGADAGKLRLKEPKPDAMKELVDKLNDGSVTIAGEKVGGAKVLEGEEEEEYWVEYTAFLNNRKRMREEEKRVAQARNKRQRFGGRGGGGWRGGGRGGRGYMRGGRR